MPKNTAQSFAQMLKKEASETKMAGKPCKKPPMKGKK